MKNVLLPCLAALALASCGTSETTPGTTAASSDTAAVSYTLDTVASHVNWAGTMLGVKTHTGTLAFDDGTLQMAGDQLVGGNFTVDMTSYAMTDTNYAADGAAQGTRANLMGHLMSPDFFAVETYPTASFKFVSVNGSTGTGELTVRGKTSTETVTNIVISKNGTTITATGDLAFDRQKYGVSWAAPHKDMVLSNTIKLNIAIQAEA